MQSLIDRKPYHFSEVSRALYFCAQHFIGQTHRVTTLFCVKMPPDFN